MEQKNIISTIYTKLIIIMSALANILIAGISLLVLAEVISLFFFGKPIRWAIEVTEYMLVFITFLAATKLLKEERHIRFELVIAKLKGKYLITFEVLSSIIGLVVCVIILYASFHTVLDLYGRGIKTETHLEIPRYLLISIIPFSFFLLTIQYALRLKTWLMEFKSKGAAS
ncbi:MAG TPA: TRAP transporter small permease [Bacillales bacterium]|nr:TRAP transporter small permease [Bacillales bacterium]